MKPPSVLLALWIVLAPSEAAAQSEVPIIEAGREEEVLALFAPYGLTGAVTDDFRLMNVRIDATHIVCELVGSDGEEATLRLEHPDQTQTADGETASFAYTLTGGSPEARAALDAIVAAVRHNDEGRFYRRRARPPFPGAVGLMRQGGVWSWVTDGVVLSALGLAFFLVLLGRELVRGSRPVLYGVVLATALAAIVRVAMAPQTIMGAWPFSRTTHLVERIWSGPGLATIVGAAGAELRFFEAVSTVNLIFAIATPPAVFLHAKKLLDHDRVALFAAVVVASLPVHIRFSQSEVAFIPSLALSSFTFALVHFALKDRSRAIRATALVALPVVAGAMFVARPLNQVFLPLLLWTALYLARRDASLSRRIFVSVLLTAVGVFTFVTETRVLYGGQIEDGASLQTIWNGIRTFFSPWQNTLINPWITPPLLTLLAAAGGYLSLRGSRPTRERGVFLIAWLLAFYVTHAYVLPRSIAMQARYHLHLVVPFAMMAAIAAGRLYVRRRSLFAATCLYVLVMPLMHADFVGDVEFDVQREYAFVRAAAERMPEACTVLEFTGRGTGDVDVRFARTGAVLEGETERRLFTAIPIGADAASAEPLRAGVRDILAEPPECLYYYEGLFCFGRKGLAEPIAPACAEMRRTAHLEEVMSTTFDHRVYDGNLAEGMRDGHGAITLSLHRVVGARR